MIGSVAAIILSITLVFGLALVAMSRAMRQRDRRYPSHNEFEGPSVFY